VCAVGVGREKVGWGDIVSVGNVGRKRDREGKASVLISK